MKNRSIRTAIKSIVTAIFFLVLINNAFSGIDTVYYPILPDSEIKNVIFMIGDGMGLAQVASTRVKTLGAGGKLSIERMPVTGLVKTHAANSLITCSAAGGTALSTGFKTNIGLISVDPAGNKLKTILEACKENNKATGIVVTSSITDATPASFGAHVNYRENENKIASQLIENRFNVLLGGGRMFFMPQSERGSEREDDVNLIDKAKEIGYSFIQTKEELAETKGEYLLGLFQLNELTARPPEPSLAEMTGKTIEVLGRNKNGFFLMVEGSQIDWKCHDNDEEEVVRQVSFFDEAVKTALEFALKDQHTLVIVTADHETGGMGIEGGKLNGENLDIEWITHKHTGVPVIIYAFGPHAVRFTGVHDNTEIPRIIGKIMDLKNFPTIIK